MGDGQGTRRTGWHSRRHQTAEAHAEAVRQWRSARGREARQQRRLDALLDRLAHGLASDKELAELGNLRRALGFEPEPAAVAPLAPDSPRTGRN